MGVGPAAQQERETENWWDRDEPSSNSANAVTMTLGQQAEMFDDAGQAAVQPVERPVLPVSSTWTLPEAKPVAQTLVSVHSKSKVTARVIATTRVVSATRVSSVAKTATVARGAVARQLLRSQSISSGREGARWYSVPPRVLLPRYHLFDGADAVTEDAGGRLSVGSPSTRTQHGQVWFV